MNTSKWSELGTILAIAGRMIGLIIGRTLDKIAFIGLRPKLYLPVIRPEDGKVVDALIKNEHQGCGFTVEIPPAEAPTWHTCWIPNGKEVWISSDRLESWQKPRTKAECKPHSKLVN